MAGICHLGDEALFTVPLRGRQGRGGWGQAVAGARVSPSKTVYRPSGEIASSGTNDKASFIIAGLNPQTWRGKFQHLWTHHPEPATLNP